MREFHPKFNATFFNQLNSSKHSGKDHYHNRLLEILGVYADLHCGPGWVMIPRAKSPKEHLYEACERVGLHIQKAMDEVGDELTVES